MSGLSRLWDGGHWTSQSLKGLGPRKPIRDCNIDEVSAQFRLTDHASLHFGDVERSQKALARDAVIELFSPDRFPHRIKVLSMPGVKWEFEAALLKKREGIRRFSRQPAPALTEIHAVENDRAVYYDALMRVPGIRNRGNIITDLGRSPVAERALGYMFVKRYLFANVDDILATDETFDCVWLDYFGPMTIERMALVRRFFDNNVRDALVVTNLKARWNTFLSSKLQGFDEYKDWIFAEFDDVTIEHYIEYFDTSPMVQFAVTKPRAAAQSDADLYRMTDGGGDV